MGKKGLPEKAAVSNPAITKKDHMSGAISDCYARLPVGSTILGPGSGHGRGVPLTLAVPFAAAVVSSSLQEKALLHACGQTRLVNVSHASVLYLWFWSPGSQACIIGAGRESPTASAVNPPNLAEPHESQSETHIHTL